MITRAYAVVIVLAGASALPINAVSREAAEQAVKGWQEAVALHPDGWLQIPSGRVRHSAILAFYVGDATPGIFRPDAMESMLQEIASP